MVCNGPYWCLVDCMLRKYQHTLSKTAKAGVIKNFGTDRQFLRDRQKFGKFIYMAHISSKSGWTYLLLCLIRDFWHKFLPFSAKLLHDIYFCSYSDWSVAFRSCGRLNVCRSRKWKWNLFPVLYIAWKLLIINTYNPTKVQPSIQKKKNSFFTTCARKSKKRCAKVSVGHKMFALIDYSPRLWFRIYVCQHLKWLEWQSWLQPAL